MSAKHCHQYIESDWVEMICNHSAAYLDYRDDSTPGCGRRPSLIFAGRVATTQNPNPRGFLVRCAATNGNSRASRFTAFTQHRPSKETRNDRLRVGSMLRRPNPE